MWEEKNYFSSYETSRFSILLNSLNTENKIKIKLKEFIK